MKEGFDIDSLFSESFGMYLAKADEVRLITFRTDPVQARFLRDLPLHGSQTEGITDEDGMVHFHLRVAVNEALMMELMRLADKIEILAPAELRESISERLQAAAKKYK